MFFVLFLSRQNPPSSLFWKKERNKQKHSHGLVVLKLQLAGDFFIVLSCFRGAFNGVVGHRHLPSCPGRPMNLHLHVADTLADPRGLALKCEYASMIVVIDGNRGNGSTT